MKKIILVFITLFVFASCKEEQNVMPNAPQWAFENESYIVTSGDFLPIGEKVMFVGAKRMEVGTMQSGYSVTTDGRYITSFSECSEGFSATRLGARYVILSDCSGKIAKLQINK